MNILALFPLSPAFFGGIQIIAPSGVAPTLQFSILISLLLVFVDELDQKITKDSLTQLTNRYEFEHILQGRMRGRDERDPKLYVLVCDLDGLKNINDNHGHMEGDEALKLVARTMSRTGSRYDAICARMSGDEFLSLIEAEDGNVAESYAAEIQSELEIASEGRPYSLVISIGIAEYDSSMTLMELLEQADRNMYAQKRQHKRGI